MKVSILILALLILFFSASSVMAIYSRGNINETYKYANLEIKENGDGTCTISGEIINKTNQLKDSVWIKIHAFDIFKKFLWSNVLFFSTIPAKDGVVFAERIYRCSDDDPYILKFKVTD